MTLFFKKNRFFLLLFFVLIIGTLIAAQTFSKSDNYSDKKDHLKGLEIPLINDGDAIVEHSAFTLLYDEEHEQARWVAHYITKERVQDKVAERNNYFAVDKSVETVSAKHADYIKTGYDRGHLVPAADMHWDQTMMDETFYMSNISPQRPNLNRRIWKYLEEQVRDWALLYDTLYIVTGPVLKDGLPTIGENEVSVPEYHYKVVLNICDGRTQAIGFILPNTDTFAHASYRNYAVSIDDVEEVTGIDFYPALDDELENSIEANVCDECWQWN